MKMYIVLLCSLAFFLLSCDDNSVKQKDDPPPLETATFYHNEIIMTADNSNAILNFPITLTQQCTPLYSGKGTQYIELLGGRRKVLITNPVNDSLVDFHQMVGHEVTLTANQQLTFQWKIILKEPKPAGF